MKKFSFLIFSTILALLFALTGCSCAGEVFLEFDNKATKDIKTEVLIYSVNLEKNYQSINLDKTINENLLPEYINGKMIMEFTSEGKELPTGVSSNINFENINSYNYLKTTFLIDVLVNKGTADEKTFHDKIVSEVYFHSADWSFAPVYSRTTVKNTFIGLSQTEVETAQEIYEYSTTYNKDSYTLTKTHYQPSENEDIDLIDIENTTNAQSQDYFNKEKLVAIDDNGVNVEYSLRTVLDNVQLLFALRNKIIANDVSIGIPTSTYMYKEPMTIIASNNNQANITTKINYNGQVKEGENGEDLRIPVNNISLSFGGTNNVGAPKYLSIQNEEISGIKNNALIFEYAEAVYEYSASSIIGALVYKLTEVQISYN